MGHGDRQRADLQTIGRKAIGAILSLTRCPGDRLSIRRGGRRGDRTRILHYTAGAILLILACAAPLWFRGADVRPPEAATGAPAVRDFALLDHEGRFRQFHRERGAEAIVLYSYGVACPVSRQGIAALREIEEQFAGRRIVVWLVDSNLQNDRLELAAEAELVGSPFPILHDEAQLVASLLGIERTGEAILIDPGSWKILYRGPVDDRAHYDGVKATPGQRHLARALEQLFAGERVAPDRVPAVGCLISRPDPTRPVSYRDDVAPILERKCADCHAPGAVAPWAMDSWETVSGWRAMIQEVLLTRRMPPWDADPHVGGLRDDRRLRPEEARTLIDWIAQGAPRGAGEDPLRDRKPASRELWPLGPPDRILTLPAQSVPASGAIDYRYVQIPFADETDRWVCAADIRPSDPRVMHHALLYLVFPDRPGLPERDADLKERRFVAVYAPGFDVSPFPEGSGELFPAGVGLVFELHYQSVGYAATDEPRLGLYFCDDEPHLELYVASAYDESFRIPPRERDHPVEAEYLVQEPMLLHGFLPHMHLRGSRFRYEVTFPDGRRETLLSVPRYRFSWQRPYYLAEPMPIPKGTHFRAVGSFDNSPSNPVNPDPDARVRWGRQSWEEMFIGYLFFTRKPYRREVSASADPARAAAPSAASGAGAPS